jgi:hypothetical protein
MSKPSPTGVGQRPLRSSVCDFITPRPPEGRFIMPPSAPQTLFWIVPLALAPCPVSGVNDFMHANAKMRFPKTDF